MYSNAHISTALHTRFITAWTECGKIDVKPNNAGNILFMFICWGGIFLFLNSGLLPPWIMQHVHLDSTEKRPKDYPKFSDYQSVFTGDGTAVDGFIICKKNVYKNVYKTAGKGSTKISHSRC